MPLPRVDPKPVLFKWNISKTSRLFLMTLILNSSGLKGERGTVGNGQWVD